MQMFCSLHRCKTATSAISLLVSICNTGKHFNGDERFFESFWGSHWNSGTAHIQKTAWDCQCFGRNKLTKLDIPSFLVCSKHVTICWNTCSSFWSAAEIQFRACHVFLGVHVLLAWRWSCRFDLTHLCVTSWAQPVAVSVKVNLGSAWVSTTELECHQIMWYFAIVNAQRRLVIDKCWNYIVIIHSLQRGNLKCWVQVLIHTYMTVSC